jgi:hypothetical protein
VALIVKRRTTQKHRNGIVFEIGDQISSVRLRGQRMNDIQHYTFYAQQNIDAINVKLFPRPVVVITWPDLQITHVLTETAVAFQSVLPVSFLLARRVAEIIRSQRFYVLPQFIQDGVVCDIQAPSAEDQESNTHLPPRQRWASTFDVQPLQRLQRVSACTSPDTS